MKIRDIAETRAGYQFRGVVREVPGGSHRVIQIRDFDEHRRLRVDDLARVEPERSPEPYLARDDDVLFLSRGHRLWASHLREAPEKAVVTGYFFIVRPRQSTVRAAYLAWYFNEAPFQSVLRQFMRGSHMPLVSLADFGELDVEVPPLAVQDAVVALGALAMHERELLAVIQAKRQTLIERVCLRAVRGSGFRGGE
jgi:hypothetical protein